MKPTHILACLFFGLYCQSLVAGEIKKIKKITLIVIEFERNIKPFEEERILAYYNYIIRKRINEKDIISMNCGHNHAKILVSNDRLPLSSSPARVLIDGICTGEKDMVSIGGTKPFPVNIAISDIKCYYLEINSSHVLMETSPAQSSRMKNEE